MKTMKVWIAAIYHCDGFKFQCDDNGRCRFESEAEAKEAIYEYVYFYWIHENELEDDMPEDKDKAIEMWFSKKDETYLIHSFDMPLPTWA